MSGLCFVDTSAWYARIVKEDFFHDSAVRFAADFAGSFLTTNYVLLETTNLLHLRQGYSTAKRFLEIIQESQLLSIHNVTPEDHSVSVQLFLQNKRHVSLTDCSSFMVMRKLEIENAFTFDQDFARSGFSCLPDHARRE